MTELEELKRQLASWREISNQQDMALDRANASLAECQEALTLTKTDAQHWRDAYSEWVNTDECARKLVEKDQQLAEESVRADFAWENTRIIDKALQEEMRKRDVAEAKMTECQTDLLHTTETYLKVSDELRAAQAREAQAREMEYVRLSKLILDEQYNPVAIATRMIALQAKQDDSALREAVAQAKREKFLRGYNYGWNARIENIYDPQAALDAELRRMAEKSTPHKADGGVVEGTNRTTSGAIGQP